jgi:hypothetical protein
MMVIVENYWFFGISEMMYKNRQAPGSGGLISETFAVKLNQAPTSSEGKRLCEHKEHIRFSSDKNLAFAL